MAWAVWGLRDHLLQDPDVWLCHQCNDCSTGCPRDARPGDVLAAVRLECILHYSFPRFLARWVNHPRYIPILLAIPAIFLALALYGSGLVESTYGITRDIGDRVIYSYSSHLHHWVVNSFFALFGVLALFASVLGVLRFLWAMKAAGAREGAGPPVKGRVASLLAALGKIVRHDDFASCTAARSRLFSHALVLFGFVALTVVTLSVITARFNPLFADGFVYPYGFFSPWKILANLGGGALILGCLWMGIDRLRADKPTGGSSYADWALIVTLFLVTASGFAVEVLHYVRLEPHRHAVYFVHLVLVFALLVYLPYSKLAHMLYRTVAMAYAERMGRGRVVPPDGSEEPEGEGPAEEGEEPTEDSP